MIDHSQIVDAAENLKPLPQAAAQLATIIVRPEPDIEEIVQVISYDQVLTMQLLRAANSASSGSVRTISTVKDAVVRMGTGSILCLAIGAGVMKEAQRPIPEYGYLESDFWRHSVATSLVAGQFRKHCSEMIPAESFTACLLHDFGKLVLSGSLQMTELELMSRACRDGGMNPASAESQLLGISHADVGGIIAQHWKLPESIVEAIVHHHDPRQMPAQSCYVVHLANEIAKVAAGARDIADLSVDPETWDRLGMKPDDVGPIAEAVSQEIDQVLAMYQ